MRLATFLFAAIVVTACSQEPPPEGGPPRRPWQKDHQPNLTGTELAYRPPGHTLKGGRRDPATGDYEPWSPE